MSTDPDTLARYRLHAELAKVLTDPKRLMLLDALRDADRTVGELATALGMSLPNTSQHLAVLRAAGLVDGRREGASVRYRIAEPSIVDACDIVHGIVDRRLAVRSARISAGVAAPAAAGAPAPVSTPIAG